MTIFLITRIFPIVAVIIGYILDKEKIIMHPVSWWLYGFICGITEMILINLIPK